MSETNKNKDLRQVPHCVGVNVVQKARSQTLKTEVEMLHMNVNNTLICSPENKIVFVSKANSLEQHLINQV